MKNFVERDARGCVLAPSVTADQIKAFRKQMKMTQEKFAVEFNVPLGTLRDWEQGARQSRATQFFVRAVAGELKARGSNEASTVPATTGQDHDAPHFSFP